MPHANTYTRSVLISTYRLMSDTSPPSDEPSTLSESPLKTCRWKYTKVAHLRCHLFLLFGSFATVLPYTSTQADELGIDTPYVAIMMAVVPVTTVLATGTVSQCESRNSKLKLVLILIVLVQSSCHLLTIHIRPIEHHSVYEHEIEPSCSTDNVTLSVCMPGPMFNHTALCKDTWTEDAPGDRTALICALACGCFCKPRSTGRSCVIEEKFLQGCSNTICMTFDISNYTFLCNSNIVPPCELSCTRSPSQEHADVPSNSSRRPKLPLWSKAFWKSAVENPQIVKFLALRLSGIVLSGLAVTFTVVACHLVISDAWTMDGRELLWGSAGWGVVSLLTGHLNHFASKDDPHRINFTFAMRLMTAINLLDVVVLLTLPLPRRESKPQPILMDAHSLYRTLRTTVYLSLTFLMGSLSGVIWTYGPLGLRIIGAHPVLVGATLAVQGLGGELLNFFLSNVIVQSLGLSHAVNLSIVGMFVRLLVYGLGFTPWLVLPVELLQGFTLGLFIKGSIALVSMAGEEGIERQVHQVISTMYHGVGACFGAFVAGCIIYVFDFTTAYVASSSFALFGLCVHVLYTYFAASINTGVSERRHVLVTFSPSVEGGSEQSRMSQAGRDSSTITSTTSVV
ncbi:uncharacterized protein LOC135396181 isoform X2 [Ornithodoros turicata]|uniref:uncharacterized protein LOC135396181 isoform X2 n=1 Tax=Ornithodoros turicata TaxID=34597 RepID=UPI00313978FB